VPPERSAGIKLADARRIRPTCTEKEKNQVNTTKDARHGNRHAFAVGAVALAFSMLVAGHAYAADTPAKNLIKEYP